MQSYDMEREIVHILLLIVFASVLPYPRVRLYAEIFVVALEAFIMLLFWIVDIVRLLADVIKVDALTTVISVSTSVSTIAPRVGQYVLSRQLGVSRIKEYFDTVVGEEMIQFRRDLRNMSVEKLDPPTDVDPVKLLAEIKRARSQIRRRHTIGEVLITIVMGIIAIAVSSISLLAGLSLLLSSYLIIFSLSMLLRTAIVDTLSYSVDMVDADAEKRVYRKEVRVLLFMKAWNQMLVRKERIIHKIILVSFARGEFILGYERGIELMEQVVTGDKDIDEALDELIETELGEETTETKWIRSIIKRWLGV